MGKYAFQRVRSVFYPIDRGYIWGWNIYLTVKRHIYPCFEDLNLLAALKRVDKIYRLPPTRIGRAKVSVKKTLVTCVSDGM